jgi:phospholipid-binding lipoprotein MlaA
MRNEPQFKPPARNDSKSFVSCRRAPAILFVFITSMHCNGCASGPSNPDPWEKTNRVMYNVTDDVDRVAIKPVADFYAKVVPRPIRGGISNFFENLVYFNVILNDFLQGKGDQGLGDTGRMAANSTIGIGGILDVATGWGLPAHDNDFGITLGKWGCGPGPYVFLPLLGPATIRDATAAPVQSLATPTTWLSIPLIINASIYVVSTVNLRYSEDEAARFRSAVAIDPYVFTRDAYLQYREGRIHEGKPTTSQSIYDEDSDSEPAAAPAATGPASKSVE